LVRWSTSFFVIALWAAFGAHASSTASAVFKIASPSVVLVSARTSTGERQGSAVAFKTRCYRYKNDDPKATCEKAITRLSTNAHVVGDSSHVRLIWDTKESIARVIYRDAGVDLAILEMNAEPLPVSEPKSKRQTALEVGESVFAIGAPLGLQRTLSEGIISGLRLVGNTPEIQTTSAISPGSSGGGLFDSLGRFIGVPTYKLVRGEALNFAVDADLVSFIDMALTLRAEIASFMNRQGESFPADYGGEEFIRWFAEPPLDARERLPRYAEYLSAERYAAKKKDPGILVAWVKQFQDDFQGYIATTARPKKTAPAVEVPEPDQASSTFRLVCTYRWTIDASEGTEVYRVDLSKKTINDKPATIDESFITWREESDGHRFKLVINRVTSDFEVENLSRGRQVLRGACVKARGNQF